MGQDFEPIGKNKSEKTNRKKQIGKNKSEKINRKKALLKVSRNVRVRVRVRV